MNNRRWNLDIIRIMACFFVIVIHVVAYSIPLNNPRTFEWCFSNFIMSIVKSAVPLFFMISGTIFLSREVSLDKLYRKYIFRIIVAMFGWGVFYAIFDSIDYAKTTTPSIRYFILRILSGHYHLWFLPAILGVYICFPLLKALVDKLERKQILYLFLIVFVTVIGKTTLEPILSIFFNTSVWDLFWNNLSLSNISVGLVYFLTGYFAELYKNRISKKCCLMLFIISVFCGAAINMFIAFYINKDIDLTRELLSIWIYGTSVALFLYLIKKFDGYHPGKMTGKILKEVSECTFGIYLVHAFFIEQVCLKLGLQEERLPYIFSVIVFSLFVFLCSLLITWILKKIPGLKKYIV